MGNPKSLDNLIKRMAKASSIVGCVHLCKPKQGTFNLPIVLGRCINPMTGDSKIGIAITCLPSVTSQTDHPNIITLEKRNESVNYV